MWKCCILKISKHRKNQYNFLHIGLVQIAVQSLTSLGLNAVIILCLRDCRHNQFDDSLLGAVQTSLCKGPQYFNCYPNFSVSLTDPTIIHALTLNIKSYGYDMMGPAQPYNIIYRVHYKVYTTNVSPQALIYSPKGETLLI